MPLSRSLFADPSMKPFGELSAQLDKQPVDFIAAVEHMRQLHPIGSTTPVIFPSKILLQMDSGATLTLGKIDQSIHPKDLLIRLCTVGTMRDADTPSESPGATITAIVTIDKHGLMTASISKKE